MKGIDHKWVDRQIEARDAAKAAKDWATADAIRLALDQAGVQIKDTKEGVVASGGGTDWQIAQLEARIGGLKHDLRAKDAHIAALERYNNDYSARVQQMGRVIISSPGGIEAMTTGSAP